LKENLPKLFKDPNFTNTLDESSKRWLQSLSRTLHNNLSQSQSTIQKQINNENINNSSNNFPMNNTNLMQINNFQNMSQMSYDNFYYNPNVNGFIPNENNGNNMFFGNNSYYISLAKMYPNNVNNFNITSLQNHSNLSGNFNLDKKL
jgi:hypothetical protein